MPYSFCFHKDKTTFFSPHRGALPGRDTLCHRMRDSTRTAILWQYLIAIEQAQRVERSPAPCRCLRLASFRGKKRPRKLLISGHYLPVALRLRSRQNALTVICERFPLGEYATRHPLKADGASTAPLASPVAVYLPAFLRDRT